MAQKKGKEADLKPLSLIVARTVQLSNQIKERFKVIYELRAFIPVVPLKPAKLRSEVFRAVG